MDPRLHQRIEPANDLDLYLSNSEIRGPINPGDVSLWQQDDQEEEAKKRITLLIENKKCVYALVLEECSTKLDSKIKGSDKYI